MSPRRLLVVGNGMAAARLVDQLRQRRAVGQRGWSITVCGAEPRPAYNRILLSEVVQGRVRPDAIGMVDQSGWSADRVVTRLATTVVSIDSATRSATTATGERLEFDHCVFATGSRPLVPPLRGLPSDDGRLNRPLPSGVLTFRTIDDALAMVGWSSRVAATRGPDAPPRAVVLGGGLLGLEAAGGLLHRGILTTVVHMADHVMERQLDRVSGAMLAASFERDGLSVLTGARANEVLFRDGQVSGLALADGRQIPADLVVVSAGVRPNTEVAATAGLPVGRGILVDDSMRVAGTQDFSAIGECAEHAGVIHGLVAPTWEQADVLAESLVSGTARYTGSRLVTRLKVAGLGVTSIGDATPDTDDLGSARHVVTITDAARDTYQKLVVTDGRLTGAILIGDQGSAPRIVEAYEHDEVLPADRIGLLRPMAEGGLSDPALIPARATICRCNGVTKGAICEAYLSGATTVDGIAERTRATTGCGGCTDSVCGIVDWLRSSDDVADQSTNATSRQRAPVARA